MNLTPQHNWPLMAKFPEITPGNPLDPIALVWPGLPFFVRIVIGYILMWKGLYAPFRAFARQYHDVTQMLFLADAIDVETLTYLAQRYELVDMIAEGAREYPMTLCGHTLGSASGIPELGRLGLLTFNAVPMDETGDLQKRPPLWVSCFWAALSQTARSIKFPKITAFPKPAPSRYILIPP